jgi:phage shock protein A
MFQTIKKWWKYMGAKMSGTFEEKADPKIQLEQAITEARQQHQRLTEQATNVIASQKQAEIRLNNKLGELERLNANARQALRMADDAATAGDAAKAASYGHTAETIANQLIQVEKDVDSLKSLVIESTQAADQAKSAVQLNSRLLQDKIAEKSKLLSQLEQAKMQEELNSAMTQLTASVGDDVPTLAEVKEKIEVRYSKAKAASELSGQSAEVRMLEVEQATVNMEAQDRLAAMRAELGLGAAPGSTPIEPPAG